MEITVSIKQDINIDNIEEIMADIGREVTDTIRADEDTSTLIAEGGIIVDNFQRTLAMYSLDRIKDK